MSRLILLMIFAVWLVGAPGSMAYPAWGRLGLGVFLVGYAILVAGVAIWSRRLARRIDSNQVTWGSRRYNLVLTIVRTFIPIWLAAGLYSPLGWGDSVLSALHPFRLLDFAGLDAPPLALPGLLVGTLPAILAWMGLWWAQYPADRALREQSLLDQAERDLPIHPPPSFAHYFTANIRLQLFFMLLPVVLILAVHDVALVGMRFAGLQVSAASQFENWIMLPAGGLVFLFAPELLRRVLKTEPLPPSPLRTRLEGISSRAGLKYRQILLWHTQYSMGNAAVMGLIPQMRYVLLSDLLLETATDEQIEAVFAHETGHIVHHHMMWYAVFFGALLLAAIGPGSYVDTWINAALRHLPQYIHPDEIQLGISLASVLLTIVVIFGYLSRRFERQADVFAARMIESNWGMRESGANAAGSGESTLAALPQLAVGVAVAAPDPSSAVTAMASSLGPPPTGFENHKTGRFRGPSHVGPHGANAVASALHRVASVNNIPISARSWCHGSIARRMNYLRHLSSDPALTGRFDRLMSRLYVILIAILLACGAIAMLAGVG